MERALCMAHWLKHCKVNEPIYILSAAIWVKWRGRCSPLSTVTLCCSTQRNVSGPQRLMSTFHIQLVVKNNDEWTGNRCSWKVLEKYTEHRPDCLCRMCLISFNPVANGWIMSAWWMVNVTAVRFDYNTASPALAIVLHKKWRSSVAHSLTPPHLKKKKKKKEGTSGRGDSSANQAMRNPTGHPEESP